MGNKIVIIFISLLLFTSVSAQKQAVDYNKWELSNGSYERRLGSIRTYPDTDSTFDDIDNNLVLDGDSAFYCDKANLKTRVSNNGTVKIGITWNNVNYEITQQAYKLVWLNVNTKNWTDVIPNLSWSVPIQDSNIVTWNFPGFDYSLIKGYASVQYRISFKPAFLDSAVTLYNQRSDSQYIALGNVHRYSFANIDDSVLVNVADVDSKKIKKLGKFLLRFKEQRMQWNGSDSSVVVPVKQRWVKVGAYIYCVEYVMMNNLKKIHESYPTESLWHNTEVTLDGTNWKDAYVDQWGGNDGDNNYGGDVYCDWFNYDYLIKLDLSSFNNSDIIDSVQFDGEVAWDGSNDTVWIYRLLTDFVAGVEDDALVTSGNPGCTWNNSIDYYAGEGTDVTWASGAYSASDKSSTKLDSFQTVSKSSFTSRDEGNSLTDAFQKMVDGTYSVTNLWMGNKVTGSGSIYTLDRATESERPYWTIWYHAGTSSETPNLNWIHNIQGGGRIHDISDTTFIHNP